MIFIQTNSHTETGQKLLFTTYLSEAVYKACSDFYDAVSAPCTMSKMEHLGVIAKELVKVGFFKQHDFWPEPKKTGSHETYICTHEEDSLILESNKALADLKAKQEAEWTQLFNEHHSKLFQKKPLEESKQ